MTTHDDLEEIKMRASDSGGCLFCLLVAAMPLFLALFVVLFVVFVYSVYQQYIMFASL